MQPTTATSWIALPNMIIFQILLPLVSPFIDLMFAFGAIWYGIQKHFHPESANPADFVNNGGVVTFVTNGLASGQSFSFTVTVTPQTAGTITNFVTVTSSTVSEGTNVATTVSAQPTANPDLARCGMAAPQIAAPRGALGRGDRVRHVLRQ